MRCKRALDLVLVIGFAPLWGPLLFLVSVLVWWGLGRPILFRQTRPGLRGEPFTLLKFRTMTEGLSPSGELLPDAARMTSLGKWLRRTSLDELPELINVLRGEMSLVGPRPLLMDYLPLYTPEQRRRHDVLPGLTGWAQVHGRNAISWDERFRLDIWYVEHQSLLLDFRVLARTASQIVCGHGICAPGHCTMPPFEGRGGREASAAIEPSQPVSP